MCCARVQRRLNSHWLSEIPLTVVAERVFVAVANVPPKRHEAVTHEARGSPIKWGVENEAWGTLMKWGVENEAWGSRG